MGRAEEHPLALFQQPRPQEMVHETTIPTAIGPIGLNKNQVCQGTHYFRQLQSNLVITILEGLKEQYRDFRVSAYQLTG